MNTAYTNALREHGASLITHVALVDESGVPVGARQPIAWVNDADAGRIRPAADVSFDVTAGDVIAGWRGHSALTDGTDFGGADFAPVTFANAGTFTLDAALVYVDHNNA